MKNWERNLRGRLLPSDADWPPDTPLAAVAIVLRMWQDDIQVLLIERMRRDGDPWSGQIALPGGMMDPGDLSLSETAQREVLEEVSIDLDDACVALGRLQELRPANVPRLVVHPFVYSLRKGVPVKEGEEVRRTFWVALSGLRQSETTKRVVVRGHELFVPAFLHGDIVIWGLTYRILTTFLDIGFDLAGSLD